MINFRTTISRANKKMPLKIAASLLAASSLIASLLGLLRDRLLNGLYADTYATGLDAYTVAFTIPDFMFFVLVSGALSVTFIPVFNQRLATGNKRSAWELSTSLLNLLALVTLAASIIIIIFAEQLVQYVVGPGLDESSRSLATSMMRVIAINPFLFGVATVFASMQQAVGRFAFFALAPVVYNIGIIIGALFFTDGINIFGWQVFEGGIMGVALGVALGSILQLIVSSLGLYGMGFDYRFKVYWRNKGLHQVLRLLPPRSLDQGIDYVNGIVETNLASRMASGSIRAYQQVTALSYVPINLIGIAISTAAFPKMTERIGQGRPDLFKKELLSVLRVIIWLSLPVTVISVLCRGYLIHFIKPGGDQLWADIMGILAFSIIFRSIYFISARSFYAQQDTKTPLYISIFTISLNIALAIWLSLGTSLGVVGLALAAVITAAVEVAVLFIIMSWRLKGLFTTNFIRIVWRMISATGIMAVVTYVLVSYMPLGANDVFISAFSKFSLIVGVSLAVYIAICRVFKIEEVYPILLRIRKLLFKQSIPK